VAYQQTICSFHEQCENSSLNTYFDWRLLTTLSDILSAPVSISASTATGAISSASAIAVASATAAEDRLSARARDFVAHCDSVDTVTRVLAVDADASDSSAMETVNDAAVSASASASAASRGDVLTVFDVVQVTASADTAHAPLTAHVIRAYRHRSNALSDSSDHSISMLDADASSHAASNAASADADANACVLIASAVPSLATAADIERAFVSQRGFRAGSVRVQHPQRHCAPLRNAFVAFETAADAAAAMRALNGAAIDIAAAAAVPSDSSPSPSSSSSPSPSLSASSRHTLSLRVSCGQHSLVSLAPSLTLHPSRVDADIGTAKRLIRALDVIRGVDAAHSVFGAASAAASSGADAPIRYSVRCERLILFARFVHDRDAVYALWMPMSPLSCHFCFALFSLCSPRRMYLPHSLTSPIYRIQ
jgi:hypothetical protein